MAIQNPLKNSLIGGFYLFYFNTIKLACIQEVRTCKIHQAH